MKTACVFSIDDSYVVPFQVFFHSLEKTRSVPSQSTIFILHSESLSSSSIDTLKTFLLKYQRSAVFLDATAYISRDLPIGVDDHVSIATFYRLFIADLLPSEFERAVYLDSDMLALRSIADLFELPVHSHVAAADHLSPKDQLRLWGDTGGTYFQAGVLVIPLTLWREQRISATFLDVITYNRERIRWWDQDVLNIALRDKWQRLPIGYNLCSSVLRYFSSFQLREKATLIHFSGGSKPWTAFNESPFTAHWDEVYKETFGFEFNRNALRPSLGYRLKSLIHTMLMSIKKVYQQLSTS